MFLIVGAGLSGCVMAERIAKRLKKQVHIIDRRNHIGGNVHDYMDENGVMVHTYGPHAFHTNKEQVWKYLSQFTEWKPYFHHVEAYIDGQSVPVPFNFNTIERLFSKEYASNIINELIKEFGINKKVTILELLENEKFKVLAQYVYEKVFLGYTMKQWGKKPEELDISVSARVPIYTSKDNRYFQDKYQAIPEKGYTKMIESIVDSSLISVNLGVDFKDINKTNYEKIIYTGMIDEYFDYSLGKLPYRSLEFKLKTIDKEYYQDTAQKNFSDNFDFTRITEYKHFLDQKTEKTTISLEYPFAYKEGINEPYYPIPSAENHILYEKYKKLANKENNTIFIGRLAEYKYYNMDQTVESSLDTFEREFYGKEKNS